MKILVAAESNVGLVRGRNEDMILVDTDLIRDGKNSYLFEAGENQDSFVMAVSDGMGGHNAGDFASEYILTEFAKRFHQMEDVLDEQQLQDYMTLTISNIHNELNQMGKEDPEKRNMGATIIIFLYYHEKFYFALAGDSRLYRFRRGILKQISRDHTLAEMNNLDRSASHVLLNAVGGGEEVYLDFFDITDNVMPDDIFLLCSDGLTDMAADEKIEETIDSLDEFDTESLVKLAHKGGGKDNVSVILARITG